MFSLWDNEGEWGVDITKGALWRKRDLSEVPIYVGYASLHQYKEKKKGKQCLDMSVNNSWILKNHKNVGKKN